MKTQRSIRKVKNLPTKYIRYIMIRLLQTNVTIMSHVRQNLR